jgi:chromate reductase
MGAIGGFGANHHLRQSLVCLNVPVLQQLEAYIGSASKLFDGNGDLTNPATAKFLAQFMDAFSF